MVHYRYPQRTLNLIVAVIYNLGNLKTIPARNAWAVILIQSRLYYIRIFTVLLIKISSHFLLIQLFLWLNFILTDYTGSYTCQS